MIESNLQDALAWHKVHAWAEGQPVGWIVGRSCVAQDCPLAWYLEHALPEGSYCVTRDRIQIFLPSFEERAWPLPGWLTRVVASVDRATSPGSFVSRETFLAILEEHNPEIDVE